MVDGAEFLRPVVISSIPPVAVTWRRKCTVELGLNKIWAQQCGTLPLHPASPRAFQKATFINKNSVMLESQLLPVPLSHQTRQTLWIQPSPNEG